MRIRIAVLLFLLLVVVHVAYGAPTRTMKDASGNFVQLIDAPCTATGGVFATMPDTARPAFKAAVVRWQGKDYAACWRPTDAHHVWVIDESGDNGHLPLHAFTPDVEA